MAESDWQRQQRRIAADIERDERAIEKERIAAEKEAERERVAGRKLEAQAKTATLEGEVAAISELLRRGIQKPGELRLDDLRRNADVPPLELGNLADPIRPRRLIEPSPPGAISRLFGRERHYQEELEKARRRHRKHVADTQKREEERRQKVADLEGRHRSRNARLMAEVERHNTEIDTLKRLFQSRDKAAVEQFANYILQELPLPPEFPREFESVFSPANEQLLVQMSLPAREIVPTVKSYRYYERPDEERSTPRPARDIADLYRSAVSQVVVLTLRNLFASDKALQRLGINAHVRAIDPATGEWEYPCLISIDVAREDFPREEALHNVSAVECLKRLKAIVSLHPYQLEPIEPVLDFDLTKFAFVEGVDAVATLDSRPNLLAMSPTNFEHLVRQLFEAQGAEGWTTTQSNDDGVDAVILNRSNLIGGLAVVQAKRYKVGNVLGPNHYRELAGTMEEKKAGWGVLVTTSRFTPGCEQKAREHGRMQLIDGPRLIWLIREHLGKDVLIGNEYQS